MSDKARDPLNPARNAATLGRVDRAPSLEHDEIDALTDLFLGESPTAPAAATVDDDIPLPPLRSPTPSSPAKATSAVVSTPPQARPARSTPAASTAISQGPTPAIPRAGEIESIVVGHLPVLTSAWVHQYARSCATKSAGPVALVRVRGRSASIDLLGQGRTLTLPEGSTLQAAVAAAAPIAAHWILSVDEVGEPELAALPGIARVTLLTGANDAAVVACYRAIKGLCLAQSESLLNPPAIRAAVMGSPQAKAEPAAARLANTVATHLARSIDVLALPDRISAGPSVPVYVGVCDLSPADLGRLIIDSVRANHGLSTEIAQPHAPITPSHASTAPLAPADPQPGLWAKVAGLRGLETRCPYAPRVELAVSESGEVHAFSHATDEPGVERALTDLTAASAWVRTNADVLRAAIPELARRVGAVPTTEHLVTSAAKPARRLLDSPIRVHLLANHDLPLIDLN